MRHATYAPLRCAMQWACAVAQLAKDVTVCAMAFVRAATPDDLMATLDADLAAPGEHLYLFFGSEDPETGASWCPDCVTADPVLRAAIARVAAAAVCHECPVGLRSSWKLVAEHPYRVHPRLRVARIPTLVRFVNGCEVGRLVEADCADQTVVEAFLQPVA